MEIWIVGGIIVALMIYASTKIKRLAASAYEREPVEADGFTIVKPEGFISPVESKYAFEAHTKEFGETDESEEMYRAQVKVTILDDVLSDDVSESERSENGVAIREFRKVLSRGGRSFELSIVVLDEHLAELRPAVNELLGSFEVK